MNAGVVDQEVQGQAVIERQPGYQWTHWYTVSRRLCTLFAAAHEASAVGCLFALVHEVVNNLVSVISPPWTVWKAKQCTLTCVAAWHCTAASLASINNAFVVVRCSTVSRRRVALTALCNIVSRDVSFLRSIDCLGMYVGYRR